MPRGATDEQVKVGPSSTGQAVPPRRRGRRPDPLPGGPGGVSAAVGPPASPRLGRATRSGTGPGDRSTDGAPTTSEPSTAGSVRRRRRAADSQWGRGHRCRRPQRDHDRPSIRIPARGSAPPAVGIRVSGARPGRRRECPGGRTSGPRVSPAVAAQPRALDNDPRRGPARPRVVERHERPRDPMPGRRRRARGRVPATSTRARVARHGPAPPGATSARMTRTCPAAAVPVPGDPGGDGCRGPWTRLPRRVWTPLRRPAAPTAQHHPDRPRPRRQGRLWRAPPYRRPRRARAAIPKLPAAQAAGPAD